MTAAAGLVPVHEYTVTIAADGETRSAAVPEDQFIAELCEALSTSRDLLAFDCRVGEDGRRIWDVRKGSRKRPVATVQRGPLEFRTVAP